MQVQDLYKFIHQAAMGSEHAVPDTAMARKWLERELAGLADIPTREPLSEPLSPDSQLVRINLRSYINSGGDPEALMAAFIRTADEYQGSIAALERYWSYAAAMVEESELPFALCELEIFFAEMQARHFPAVHHSELYRTTYHPAYRVVLHEFLSMP